MRSLARASALLGTFVARLSGRANEESQRSGEIVLSVNTDARQGNVSSPLLYGAMFEVPPIPYIIFFHLSSTDKNRKWTTPATAVFTPNCSATMASKAPSPT